MTSLPLCFLLIVLWAKRGRSLECYVCNTTRYTGCEAVVNCSAAEQFCIKFTETTVSSLTIMQSCSVICPIAKKKWPLSYEFMCCQTDRCNGAGGVGSCRTLLAVAAFLSSVRASALPGI